MNRLIVNFREVGVTEEKLEHSTQVALEYARAHPEVGRVSVTWTSPTEMYVFSGRRHWPDLSFYKVVRR